VDGRAPGPGHRPVPQQRVPQSSGRAGRPDARRRWRRNRLQIVQELSGTQDVHLSNGSRQTPLPQRILGRDLFRYLEATGLMGKTIRSRLGQRMQHRDALIGSSPRAARRRHGIQLRGRTVDVTGAEVRFDDDSRLAPGAVIWATGFALDRLCSCRCSVRTAASSISAASRPRPACTSSACLGSTRAARRCWAGSRTTPSTSPSRSPRSPARARPGRPRSSPAGRRRDDGSYSCGRRPVTTAASAHTNCPEKKCVPRTSTRRRVRIRQANGSSALGWGRSSRGGSRAGSAHSHADSPARRSIS
jgi:hypothetical protein